MCPCVSRPADPHDDSAAADHRSAELGDARRAGAPAPTLPAPRGIATTRARCQDWSASPTPSSIHVPSTGGRHHRQVELIDSDSAVTFPIRRRRHDPAAQLNNLFGHAPHDRKDPIHSVKRAQAGAASSRVSGYGHRSPRLKVIASKGRMLTGSSSFAVAMSTHSPSRSSNASKVRSVGSTSHRWPTPASA